MGRNRIFRIALLLWLTTLAIAQPPVVTETREVSLGRNGSMILRKINGHWWSTDNRMVYPPGRGGFMWELDSKPGVMEFYHHRPFDTRRGEQLRLDITVDEVEAAFGKPNRRFPMGSKRAGMWYYYGADGTTLRLWFGDNDKLAEAEYSSPGKPRRMVAAIERQLAEIKNQREERDRAAEQLREENARKYATEPRYRSQPSSRLARSSQRAIAEVEMRNAATTETPVAKRFVAKEAIESVKVGMGREEVLARLGEPAFKSAITGGDGYMETLTYHVDEQTVVTMQLLNGKIKQVR